MRRKLRETRFCFQWRDSYFLELIKADSLPAELFCQVSERCRLQLEYSSQQKQFCQHSGVRYDVIRDVPTCHASAKLHRAAVCYCEDTKNDELVFPISLGSGGMCRSCVA